MVAVGAGGAAEGAAVEAGEMLRRGEAGAERHLRHGKARLLQERMGLGQTDQHVMGERRRPEMASEELPVLVAELPTLVRPVELRNEPRLELLVDVTLAIFFLFR